MSDVGAGPRDGSGTAGALTRERRTAAHRDADFSAWLTLRQPALQRTAVLLCGNAHEAEDVLQTALAKLYLRWDRIDDPAAVDAYARRALVNETTSLWRRAWRRRERATDTLPEPTPHRDVYDEGTSAAVWATVQGLPPRSRAVVVLRYYEQLTEAETAEVLGISVGTVKSQCSRAMTTMRARVPEHLRPSHVEEDGPPAGTDPAPGTGQHEEDVQ